MNRRKFLESASTFSFASLVANRSLGKLPESDGLGVFGSRSSGGLDAWSDIRSRFLMTDELVYFNTGGIGPTPSSVLESVSETARQLQFRTNHGHNLIETARPVVAEFVGCEPNELAFSRNATEGNSTIASGMKLKQGDEVIIESHSHQGGSIAWMTRQKYEGIVVKVFDPDPTDVQANIELIRSLITKRTKLIQVSHVTAPTGIRMPVEQIGHMAKEHGLWFHIDGAQSLGMFPLKVRDLNCDSFAACCHKWMCGPLGSGVLFVRSDRLEQIIPTDVGSYADLTWSLPATLEFVDSAERFECGTRDSASISGIVETVKFLNELEMNRIEEHGKTLCNFLFDNLSEMTSITVLSSPINELRSSMISFSVAGKSCDEVFSTLHKNGFRCRPVRECGLNATRVSTHLFNSRTECEQLLTAIDRLKG